MSIQTLIIINLILFYANRPRASVVYTVVYVAVVTLLLSPLVPLQGLVLFEMAGFPLTTGGKVRVDVTHVLT